MIQNQYAGKEPEEVWQEMTNEQRTHFIEDHKWEFDLSVRNYGEWDTLTNQQRDSITRHVHSGQYAKGGEIGNFSVNDRKFRLDTDGNVYEGDILYAGTFRTLKEAKESVEENIKKDKMGIGGYFDKYAKGGEIAHFKDEGDFFTLKITKDGKLPEEHKMYPFGELESKHFHSKKEAKDFAKSRGWEAKFDEFAKGGKLGIDRKVKFRRSESNPNKWVFTITYADLIDGEKVWREYSNYVSDAYTTKKEAIKESEEVLRREDEQNKKMAHGGLIETIGSFLTEKTSLKQIFNS